MFKLLRLILARVKEACTPQAHQSHTTGNQASIRELERLAFASHQYLTGHELMPRMQPNQRQRRKRQRQKP